MNKRSFLFVPGNRPDRFDKACDAGADAVIVDLEDAVAADGKAAARESVRGWLRADQPVYLRVNGAETTWFADDLELLARPGIAGVVLPKVERAEQIAAVAERSPKRIAVVPMIETAIGLWHIETIAKSPGVVVLAFGSLDFQFDVGITDDDEGLLTARSQLVLASRAAGLMPPIDGVTMAIDDEQVLRSDVERARRLGFGGKLLIHPKQIAIVNSGFAPSAAELEWARRVVAAAEASHDNAARVDGKMIDRPVIERARAMLDGDGAASGGPR